MNIASLILAAGKGTRMKSKLPKVLHKVGGKAMVERVLETVQSIGTNRDVVIVGFGGDAVQNYLGERAEFVRQEEPQLSSVADRYLLYDFLSAGSIFQRHTRLFKQCFHCLKPYGKFLPEPGIENDLRPVMDHQRCIGRNRLSHTLNGMYLQFMREHSNQAVHFKVYLIAHLNGYGTLSCCQNFYIHVNLSYHKPS